MLYTEHDVGLCNLHGDMSLRFEDGFHIKFQFPPKVKSDGRSGEWDESPTGPNAGDPIATYKHGDPRKISMEWMYIIDGGNWKAEDVQRQLKRLRRYFANKNNSDVASDVNSSIYSGLVAFLKIGGMGGPQEMSFRLQTISIKHGDTIVGSGMNAFALRTDVSAELRCWPKVLGVQWSGDMIETPAEWY